ncbi:hypothetical protein ACWV26_00960 [Rummeliibacillus sp. JY-2-4R]
MNQELAKALINKVIKVDRGGHESSIGMVLSAADDHITVLTEKDGVVYYKTQHIKSITQAAKGGLEFNTEVPEDFEFMQAKDFDGILDSLYLNWVQINRGGPEKFEGVLDKHDGDFLTLISNNEIIRVSKYHIRSISYGLKVEKEDEQKEEENSSSKNSNKK